ncbi:hypothetical protein C9E81_15795 [Paracoccus alkanivorans]|uniref:Uncharacterized protein n=2 Tax=Paracoccus alkanivorans TaxID=2116655 RepID=A0A3M0M7K3_9RHOB|nr:hypothetical protein C9E81_15795 [Paracoccus alkanivorans]
MRVEGVPQSHKEAVTDILQSIRLLTDDYLQCLERRVECAAEKNTQKISSVSAQLLKSRALIDEARQQLLLGLAAARGEISASDLGFPEIDDPFYRDAT